MTIITIILIKANCLTQNLKVINHFSYKHELYLTENEELMVNILLNQEVLSNFIFIERMKIR